MMGSLKPRTLFLILLLLGGVCPAGLSAQQDTTRVLFVGNSFTYFYNLPQVVASMGREKGHAIVTRQSTVGGSNLEQHWKGEKGTRTRQLLEEGQWDYVVFNNHSLSPIETPDAFMEYGKKFAALVREKGAEPVFMITWAYRSNPLMQDEITRMYELLCQQTGADCVPCGPLYAKARKERPDLDLFADDKHPSHNGTYMLGLAFFKYFSGTLTNGMPPRLTTRDIDGEKLYLLFMDPADAGFLQQLVDDFNFKTSK